MMLHDSNEEKITQGSIRWANPGYRAVRFWAEILWLPDVREGACLCRRGRVALHFWVGSLNA